MIDHSPVLHVSNQAITHTHPCTVPKIDPQSAPKSVLRGERVRDRWVGWAGWLGCAQVAGGSAGGALSVDLGRGGAAGEERPKALRRSIPRQNLEAMPALAALKAAPRAGPTYEPA